MYGLDQCLKGKFTLSILKSKQNINIYKFIIKFLFSEFVDTDTVNGTDVEEIRDASAANRPVNYPNKE